MKIDPPSVSKALAQWLVALLLSVVLLTPVVLLGWIHDRASRALRRTWSKLQARLFGIDVEIVGQRDFSRRSHVFVQLNQTSLAETLVMTQVFATPCAIFVNIEYALLPFIGWAIACSGSVIVVRQWRAQARRAMDRAICKLKRGKSFYIHLHRGIGVQ